MKTKPVMKKNLNHYNNNVILSFKSAEIYIIDDDFDKSKISSPIYVPILNLKEFL